MRKLIFGLMLGITLALVPMQAHAARVVMFYGDSRCNTGGATSIPALVDAARADFTVCNKCVSGMNTATGLSGFDAAYAQCASTGAVSEVVFFIGINGLLAGITSDDATDQIREMATHAQTFGATPLIVTESTGPLAWGGFTYMNAHEYTRANVSALETKNAAGPAFILVHTRNGLLLNYVYNNATVQGHWFKANAADTTSCANDEVHPTSQGCRQKVFADPITAAIP